MRGLGRAVFAAILLMIAGTLNIILGVIQLTAAFSLLVGGVYGRVIGIAAASVGAIGALLAVGGAHPFWALGIFALCVIVIHGLVVYGEPETGERVRS